MEKKDAKKISDTFRQSAAGVKLGRILFDPGLQGKISPAQIASLLKAAGVPIPSEVTIGLQAAQLIMSGGSLITSIASGASTALQISQASASYASAAIAFFQGIGLLEDGVLLRTVQMGTDAALVLSSGGANIAADFALVWDVTQAVFFPPDERPQVTQALDRLNQKNAKDWFVNRSKGQIDKAHSLINDYQDRKISMFEFIGEFAIQSGDAFPNYFPEYKAFLPPRVLGKSFSAEQEAAHGGFLFVGRQSDIIRRVLNVNVTSTSWATQRDLVKAFISKFITDPFYPYLILAPYQGISFTALACLSVLSDDFDYIPQNFNVIPTLQKLMLMPGDLDFHDYIYSTLGSNVKNYFLDSMTYNAVKNQQYAESGISLNGMPLDKKAQEQNQKVALDNYSRKLALQCEAEGDVLRLTKIPMIRDIINKWAQLPSLTPQQMSQLPTSYRVTVQGDQLDYRNIQNFFSAVSLIDVMSSDAWLNKNGSFSDLIGNIKWTLPLRDQMEGYFEKMFNLSAIRYINAKSRENVAGFFKTTTEKVEFKNNPDGTAFIVPKGTK